MHQTAKYKLYAVQKNFISRCSEDDILHLNVWARCIFEPDSGKICKAPPDTTFLFSRPPILLIPAPSGGSSLSPGLLSARLDHLVSHMEGTARISSLAASPLKHFFCVSPWIPAIVWGRKRPTDKIPSVSIHSMFNQASDKFMRFNNTMVFYIVGLNPHKDRFLEPRLRL